jgi:hypothetical protein
MSVARDLHGAARRGDAEAVRQLLERGTDPNAQVSLEEGFAQPCFFAAATNGHLDTCVRLFWEYGADLAGTRDSAGENVLGLLGRLGKDEAAEWVHRLSCQPRPGPPKDWRELLARAIESAARDEAPVEGMEEKREEAGLLVPGREAREALSFTGDGGRQEARAAQRERTNEPIVREEPRREEAHRNDRREESLQREEAMRRAERGAVLRELAQRLAAVGAERGALARQDAALAAEQHALVAQLQLLARLS